MVWLTYSDEELLAAKRNRLAVNRTISGRRFAGCLLFFRVRQGGVLEKQEASAEEAGTGACGTIRANHKFFLKAALVDEVKHQPNGIFAWRANDSLLSM